MRRYLPSPRRSDRHETLRAAQAKQDFESAHAQTCAQAELVAAGTAVYTAAASDVGGGTVTYSLSGVDAGSFTINASTGVVTINATPDFETKSSYAINVVASGAGNMTAVVECYVL